MLFLMFFFLYPGHGIFHRSTCISPQHLFLNERYKAPGVTTLGNKNGAALPWRVSTGQLARATDTPVTFLTVGFII